MITDEQILKIAREHLYILTSVNEWCGEDGDISNFAQAIYEMGYNEGYDEGWESRAQSEHMNSSYPTGLVGDPQ
jgi:hypothetical protein